MAKNEHGHEEQWR
jgi:hypothetical protein